MTERYHGIHLCDEGLGIDKLAHPGSSLTLRDVLRVLITNPDVQSVPSKL